MVYKVITLTGTDFEKHCLQLETIVLADYRPDLVIGIRTGGLLVSEIIFKYCKHDEITLRRPTSAGKNKLLHHLLKVLPYSVLDLLRIIESVILDKCCSHKPRTGGLNIPETVKDATKILIIDDAVDSGATLKAVVDAVRDAAPNAEICSAAITVTTAHPLIMPDYCLYNNHTLIRFPWSMDAKK